MPNLFFFYATFFSCFVYPLFSPSGWLIKGPVAVAGLLMMQGGSLRSFSLIFFSILILFTSVVFRNLLCRFRSAVNSSGFFDSVFLHISRWVHMTKNIRIAVTHRRWKPNTKGEGSPCTCYWDWSDNFNFSNIIFYTYEHFPAWRYPQNMRFVSNKKIISLL